MKRGDVAIVAVAVAILAGGAGYALGHFTAAKTAASASAAQPGSGNFGGQGGGQGGGFRRGGFGTRGSVTAVSGSTITISDQNGTAHTVNISSSTSFVNGADRSAATQADVAAGQTIAASGPTASDGSITATRIIINPPAPGSFGGGGGQGSAPQTQSN